MNETVMQQVLEAELPFAGDGSKAVAKRKLQQPKLPFKPQQEQPEDQAEISGSNEPEAASPMVIPKVRGKQPVCIMLCLCVVC